MVRPMSHPDPTPRAQAWLAEDPDPETRAELKALLDAGDEEALEARFGGRLEFGTAGIRGVLGAGPLRMNRVVVRRVSAGVAHYYADLVEGARHRGVVIGYDGRKNSRVFAEDAARVFLGAGYRVWLADRPVPTPVTAFAAKDLGATAGVMVTASHNPPEYNGYKVYGPNAAQIIPPHDSGIAARIEAVGSTAELPLPELDAAREEGLLEPLSDATIERYLHGVRALSLHPEVARKVRPVVAYTPLHGVGAEVCEAALAQAGVDGLHTVAAQREPDGDFPTVRFPNPEEKGAMDLVLALAAEKQADVAVANDPDADRLAVALPSADGYRMLTGDQVGALLAYYLLEEGGGGAERLVATTLVSSQLLGRMAEARGLRYVETLTGLKWIVNTALHEAHSHGSRFVFGYEEALGYTVGDLVRDKDGISAATLFVELVAWAKSRGTTAAALLEQIYRTHGLYLTEQRSLVLPGSEGLHRIAGLMYRFRHEPPEAIGGHRVVEVVDLKDGAKGLPPSNVLVFRLEGDRRVVMRPSGTEPKLKSYYEVREPVATGEDFGEAEARARAALKALADAHQETLE